MIREKVGGMNGNSPLIGYQMVRTLLGKPDTDSNDLRRAGSGNSVNSSKCTRNIGPGPGVGVKSYTIGGSVKRR